MTLLHVPATMLPGDPPTDVRVAIRLLTLGYFAGGRTKEKK